VGSDSFHLNPCPICGHKDSCAVHPVEGYFNCFSCHTKGDVITFENAHGGHNDLLAAAKAVAEAENVLIDNGNGGRPAASAARSQEPPEWLNEGPPPEGTAQKEKPEPAIPFERGCEVRRAVAEFYHQRLMAHEGSLKYQTVQRGHSVDILEKTRVGYAGGDLVSHMQKENITPEELKACGLIKRQKGGKGWWQTIREGMFVYPHWCRGNVLFMSIKDPKKKHRYQLKKDTAAEGWICLGQDVLDREDPVIIVEGEDDRLSVMDRGGHLAAMATNGAYNERNILRRLRQVAKGRLFYLAFDEDPPIRNKKTGKMVEGAGTRYARKYAAAVTSGGGQARIIRVGPGPDGEKRDIDDLLRAAEDPKEELRILMEGATPVRLPKEKEKQKGRKEPPAPPADPEAYRFKSFEVLGELADTRLMFWSYCNERPYMVPLKDLNLDKLVQIGGEEVGRKVARSATSYSPGQILVADLKKRLIVDAGRKQLWEPEFLGQGIHEVGGRLLVVVGSRAWLWDGKTMTEYTRPMIEGRVIEGRRGDEWVAFDDVMELLSDMDRIKANKILEELLELYFQWGFMGELDGFMLAGWCLAQYVQSQWDWRPHMWMIGGAGSGKSAMRDFIAALGGRLAVPMEGPTMTEPGIRQSISASSCLVLIDEMEKCKQREAVIAYLRSAGRGGYTRKGTPEQKAVKSQLKHMVFVGSIEKGTNREAEASRYLVVSTHKDQKYDPHIPNSTDARRLRVNMVAYALWASLRAREMVRNVGRMDGHDPRFVESVAVPFSMLAVAFDKSEEKLSDMLSQYLAGWLDRSEGAQEDESKLVEDIMLSQIRIPEEAEGELRANGDPSGKTVYVIRTVSQVVEARGLIPEEHLKTLQAHGVKPIEGRGLFIHPSSVVKQLLKNTVWKELNIRDILLRVPDASAAQLRLAGSPVRGVVVPWAFVGMEEEPA